MSESRWEFLIDGAWLKPLYPPIGYTNDSAFALDGWVMTTALEFDHPKYGVIRAVPRNHLCRLVQS